MSMIAARSQEFDGMSDSAEALYVPEDLLNP
jgi:hypothetical protein